ncbi:MAG: YfdX family protein [Bacteriovoracaceae bacterium]
MTQKKLKNCRCLSLTLLLLCPTITFANNMELNAKEKKLKSAIMALPSVKDHHSTISDVLKEQLNSDALSVIEATQEALANIETKNLDSSIKSVNKAYQLSEATMAKYPNQNFLAVEYNIEVFNEAPYDLKEIKLKRKELNRIYFQENFPQTRNLLAALQSEMHMQVFQISIRAYNNVLKNAQELVKEKKFYEGAVALSNVLSRVKVEDWGVPLPYIEAEAALQEAEVLKDASFDKAKEKIELAQYQLDRAKALGYVAGEKDEFNSLQKKLKTLKKDIYKNKFNLPNLKDLKLDLIAMIKRKLESRSHSEKVAIKK